MVIYSKTFLDDDLIEKLNFYILFLVGGSWEQFKSANCRFQIEFDEFIVKLRFICHGQLPHVI